MIWLLHTGWIAMWVALAAQAFTGRWPECDVALHMLPDLLPAAGTGVAVGLHLRWLQTARRIFVASSARCREIRLPNGCKVHGLPLTIGMLAFAPAVGATPFERVPIEPHWAGGAIVLGGSATSWRPGDTSTVARPEVSIASPGQVPVPAHVDVATLSIGGGETLSRAVDRFVRSAGYSLQWNTTIDYVAHHEWSVQGRSLDEALAAALTPHGLSGTVWESNRVVEVDSTLAGAGR